MNLLLIIGIKFVNPHSNVSFNILCTADIEIPNISTYIDLLFSFKLSIAVQILTSLIRHREGQIQNRKIFE